MEFLSKEDIDNLLNSLDSTEQDKVNASLGIKQPKRGKLSKMRQGFDASKVRRTVVVLSKEDIDNLLNSLDSTESQATDLVQSDNTQDIGREM